MVGDDKMLVALVTAAQEDPSWGSSLAALQDYLIDLEPTCVKHLGRFPGWMKRLWCRKVRWEVEPLRYQHYRWYEYMSLNSFLQDNVAVDHHGITRVAGFECFVSEPYLRLQVVNGRVVPANGPMDRSVAVAEAFGCPAVWLEKADWYSGCRRWLMFPPASVPAKTLRPKESFISRLRRECLYDITGLRISDRDTRLYLRLQEGKEPETVLRDPGYLKRWVGSSKFPPE